MHREKYPEKIPFRLTRHLVNGMEMSGIEGNFRFTCENVMQVLRDNKESLMAVLEAFVHDPLINWRLIQKDEDKQKDAVKLEGDDGEDGSDGDDPNGNDDNDDDDDDKDETDGSKSTRSQKAGGGASQGANIADEAEGTGEELNERAITVIARIAFKLTGRDFNPEEELTVPKQVDRLIRQATDVEGLAQAYIGYCAYW